MRDVSSAEKNDFSKLRRSVICLRSKIKSLHPTRWLPKRRLKPPNLAPPSYGELKLSQRLRPRNLLTQMRKQSS